MNQPLPAPSFASLIKPPTEVGPPKSIMLYGRSGTRKTSTSAELIKRAENPRILFIDADQGTEALVGDPVVTQAIQSGQISIVSINTLDPNAFAQISQTIQEIATVDYGYDFVVLDTLNIMQEVAANHLMRVVVNERGVPDTRKAWGEVAVWTDTMARSLHNAPHITPIFVMHEETPEEGKRAGMTLPKLKGSAKDTIASIPSVVVNLSWEQVGEGDEKRASLVGSLGDSATNVSKNRYRLPTRIEDFTLLDLYSRIDEVRGITNNQTAVTAATN